MQLPVAGERGLIGIAEVQNNELTMFNFFAVERIRNIWIVKGPAFLLWGRP